MDQHGLGSMHWCANHGFGQTILMMCSNATKHESLILQITIIAELCDIKCVIEGSCLAYNVSVLHVPSCELPRLKPVA